MLKHSTTPCAKFASITYGASGSGQERTINFTNYLLQRNPEIAGKIALHITCIGRSQDDILQIVGSFHKKGIRQFVVVRGDGKIIESGFRYASELIVAIRKSFLDVAIYVAGYPEKPEEFKYLQDKIACGVNGVITQICFNSKKITNFAKDLKLPTLPGLIIPNEKTFVFAKNLDVALPRKISDPEAFLQKQISKLLDSGFKHLHFYTLNNIQNLLTN